MSRIRRGATILVIAALGGFLAGVVAWPLALRYDWLGTGTLLDKVIAAKAVMTKVEERTIVAPKADYFSDAIDRVQDKVVAVQTFSQGRMLRYGSGLVLTQDGLVATVGSVIPVEGSVIQATLSGKVYNAKVVWRDRQSNLAFISLTGSALSASQFKYAAPKLGDTLLVFSRQSKFGKDYGYIGTALASTVDGESSFNVTTNYDSAFYGAAVVDTSGNVLAMLDFRGSKPQLLTARTITDRLNAYLKQQP